MPQVTISGTFNVSTLDDPEDAFVVSLENSMTNVPLDENGELTAVFDKYFKVRAYYGAQSVLGDNACTVTASCSDGDVTVTTTLAKTTGIRVQIQDGVSLSATTDVVVTVTHTTYGTRTVTLTLAGVKGGENAVLQELLPSLDAVSFARTASGGLTPASRDLTLSIKKTQGGTTSVQTVSASGLTVRWATDAMPATKTAGNAWGSGTTTGISWVSGAMRIVNSVTATNVYIAAFKSDGTLVDRETIPIIKDGDNGEDGEDGKDAAQIIFTPSKFVVKANSNGTAIGAQSKNAVIKGFAKGYYYDIEINEGVTVISRPSGVSVSSTDDGTTTSLVVSVANNTAASAYEGEVVISVVIDADGDEYTLRGAFPIEASVKGDTGADGDTIRNVEIFTASDTTPTKPSSTSVPPTGWSLVMPTNAGVTWNLSDISSWQRSGNAYIIESPSDGAATIGKIAFTTAQANTVVQIKITSYSEPSWDWVALGTLDSNAIYDADQEDLAADIKNGTVATAAKVSGNGVSATYNYLVTTAGNHHVYVAYAKDDSTSQYGDYGLVEIVYSPSIWKCTGVTVNGVLNSDGWQGPIRVSGEEGQRGKTGRFFYYAGVYSDYSSSSSWIVNDAQAPFFKTGANTYHVYNPDENGTYTKSQMGSTFNQKPWEVMTNDFKYIITSALFVNGFAHLGGFIVNEDWFISQYGFDVTGTDPIQETPTTGNEYTAFVASDPMAESVTAGSFTTGWKPMLAIDSRTGEVYFAGGKFHVDTSGNMTVNNATMNNVAMNNVAMNDATIKGSLMYHRVLNWDTTRSGENSKILCDMDSADHRLTYDDVLMYGVNQGNTYYLYLPPASTCVGAQVTIYNRSTDLNGDQDPCGIEIHVQQDIDGGPIYMDFQPFELHVCMNRFFAPYKYDGSSTSGTYGLYESILGQYCYKIVLVAAEVPKFYSAATPTTYAWTIVDSEAVQPA